MKFFIMVCVVFGFVFVIIVSCVFVVKIYIGDSLIVEGFIEVFEGVYFRNIIIVFFVNGFFFGNEFVV